jgi:hypothetical protein
MTIPTLPFDTDEFPLRIQPYLVNDCTDFMCGEILENVMPRAVLYYGNNRNILMSVDVLASLFASAFSMMTIMSLLHNVPPLLIGVITPILHTFYTLSLFYT